MSLMRWLWELEWKLRGRTPHTKGGSHMVYSYAQLKGKIRVGDEVRAVPGKSNACTQLEEDGSNTQKITKVTDELFWINGCWHRYFTDGYLDLLTEHPRTLGDLREGDQVKNKYGTGTVLFVLKPGLYLLSELDSPDAVGYFYTTKDLEDRGCTLVQPEPEVIEVTVSEISAKHYQGRPVKIVKE